MTNVRNVEVYAGLVRTSRRRLSVSRGTEDAMRQEWTSADGHVMGKGELGDGMSDRQKLAGQQWETGGQKQTPERMEWIYTYFVKPMLPAPQR